MYSPVVFLVWLRLLRFYQVSPKLGPIWIMIRKMLVETLIFLRYTRQFHTISPLSRVAKRTISLTPSPKSPRINTAAHCLPLPTDGTTDGYGPTGVGYLVLEYLILPRISQGKETGPVLHSVRHENAIDKSDQNLAGGKNGNCGFISTLARVCSGRRNGKAVGACRYGTGGCG